MQHTLLHHRLFHPPATSTHRPPATVPPVLLPQGGPVLSALPLGQVVTSLRVTHGRVLLLPPASCVWWLSRNCGCASVSPSVKRV